MGCQEGRRRLIATCKQHHGQVVVVFSVESADFAAYFSTWVHVSSFNELHATDIPTEFQS